jgi:hypothetical protein
MGTRRAETAKGKMANSQYKGLCRKGWVPDMLFDLGSSVISTADLLNRMLNKMQEMEGRIAKLSNMYVRRLGYLSRRV